MIYKGTPGREEMKCQWGISLSDWFKTIVKQLHQEISFFEVTVSKDGLEFQAMNPSMSSLVRPCRARSKSHGWPRRNGRA